MGIHSMINIVVIPKRIIFICFPLLFLFPLLIYATPPKEGVTKENTSEVLNYLSLSEKYIFNFSTRDSAIYFLDKALQASPHLPKEHQYEAYYRFAELFSETGNFPVSLEYAFKCLKILDEEMRTTDNIIEIKKQQEKLYRSIAYYFSFSSIEKSMNYLNMSLKIVYEIQELDPEFPLDRYLFFIYNNIGSRFFSMNRPDSAIIYLEKALEHYKSSGEHSDEAAIYNQMGIIQGELGNYPMAREFFEKAISEAKDSLTLGILYQNLGKSSYMSQRYTEAVNYLKQGLYYCQQTFYIKGEVEICELLAKTYESFPDYQGAYQYLSLRDELKDSLNNMEKIRLGLSVEMKYQFEKQKGEEELRQQILIANNKKRILIFLLITCFLFFISIILVILYRNQRLRAKQTELEKEKLSLENEKLEENLEHKDKKLNLHTQYLLKRNENIYSTVEQASQSKNEEKSRTKGEIKIDLDEAAKSELNLLLQDLNQEFYTNLYSKHPNLTPNDKRLCTFIRLNMSTKEIAAITNQQVRSLEIARSRLRTKLGLQRHENLTSYLQQF